jgi:hypothetical protein
MHWEPMNPELVQQLLEGQEDILTPAIKAEEQLYKNTRCPVCGQDGCQKRIQAPKILITKEGPSVVKSSFGSGPLPLGYAYCIHCDTEFDPLTRVIYRTKASTLPSSQSDLLP